jgi:hypothetical protein
VNEPAPGGPSAAERFLRAVALAGALELADLKEWEEWDPERLQYRDRAEAQWLLRVSSTNRRLISTPAELEAALNDSTSAPRGIHLYISERLLGEVRYWWLRTKHRSR